MIIQCMYNVFWLKIGIPCYSFSIKSNIRYSSTSTKISVYFRVLVTVAMAQLADLNSTSPSSRYEYPLYGVLQGYNTGSVNVKHCG